MGIDPAKITDAMRRRMPDRTPLGRDAETYEEADQRRVRKTEKHIHRRYISFLNLHDLMFDYDNPTKKRTGRPGKLDFFVGPRDDRGFHVEFKVPPNDLTPEQRQFIRNLIKNQNSFLVARETSEGAALKAAIAATIDFFNLELNHE